MNFPDLETCKVIAGEFGDAEHVWINSENPYVVSRYSVEVGFNKVIAPAPTCEELGEWLHKRNFNLNQKWLGVGDWALVHADEILFFDFSYKLNETQARALAVKHILSEQQTKKRRPQSVQ